jgi:tetratricopeptide (TPR) repeat protein
MKPLALVCFVTAIAMLAWVVIHDETDEAPNIELANQSEDRNELTEPILSNSSNLSVNPDQIDPKKRVMVSRELLESLDSKKTAKPVRPPSELDKAYEAIEKALSEPISPEGYQKVFERFKNLAKAGHPESLRRTAEMLEKGLGVEEDHFEAFDYYLKAAEAGDAIAQYNVAEYLELGLVDEPDLIEASSWYTKSAELGIGDAYAQLGRIASTGALAKSDYGAALDNYEKAIGGIFIKLPHFLKAGELKQMLK